MKRSENFRKIFGLFLCYDGQPCCLSKWRGGPVGSGHLWHVLGLEWLYRERLGNALPLW
jgi:hypothetical protein